MQGKRSPHTLVGFYLLGTAPCVDTLRYGDAKSQARAAGVAAKAAAERAEAAEARAFAAESSLQASELLLSSESEAVQLAEARMEQAEARMEKAEAKRLEAETRQGAQALRCSTLERRFERSARLVAELGLDSGKVMPPTREFEGLDAGEAVQKWSQRSVRHMAAVLEGRGDGEAGAERVAKALASSDAGLPKRLMKTTVFEVLERQVSPSLLLPPPLPHTLAYPSRTLAPCRPHRMQSTRFRRTGPPVCPCTFGTG